jgi:putative MFS transporter
MTIYSAGGPFCDGYILSIIGVALALLTPQLGVSAQEAGLIGVSTLLGVFFGGAVFGYVTDLVGRQAMFVIDLIVFVVASVLLFFVNEVWQIIALRFVLGLAVGADYPIATALLTEFTPRRQRGLLLSFLVGGWWAGAMVAYFVGYALVGVGDEIWRWMLASSAIPAAVLLVARLGTPESPRWLASKGRVEEARALVRKAFGEEARLEDLVEDPLADPPRTSYLSIFRGAYAGRTAFVCAFWILQAIPEFAILTFAPQILAGFGLAGGKEAYLGSAVIGVFFFAGVIAALFLVGNIGRRPLLIWPFLVRALALVALGLAPNGPILLIVALFAVFAIVHSGSTVLQWIYPNELFPTEVRATAMGFATGMSRIGAAVGTFLLPLALSGIGVGPTMFAGAALCLVGFAVSWLFAPETKDLTLAQAGSLTLESNSSDVPDGAADRRATGRGRA